MATGLKIAINESKFDYEFFKESSLVLLEDSNVDVRKAMMLTINSAAYHKAAFVYPLLGVPEFFPLLLNQMEKDFMRN